MAAAGPRAGAQDFTFRFGEPGFENIDFSQFFGNMGRGGRAATDEEDEEPAAAASSRTCWAGCGPAGRAGRGPAGRWRRI